MSILIKGMKMPENCRDCRFGYDGKCFAEQPFHRFFVGDTHKCPLVEVVHCKDCAYMERGVKDSYEVWCCWHDSRMREDDFCSRGKEMEHE